MADYAESDYQPILTESIRENIVVPFDCFLLLKANGRIILFLGAGKSVDPAKLSKLKEHQIGQLHIKNTEHPQYLEYLRQFFNTAEGAAVLKDIQEKQKSGGEVIGIPSDFVMDTAPAPKQAVDDEAIVKLLKENVAGLHEELRFRNDLSVEETTTIKYATDHINEAVTTVESSTIVGEDGETIIKNVTDRIEEELEKITGVADKHESGKSHLIRGMIDGVRTDTLSFATAQRKSDSKEVAETAKRIKSKIMRLKRLVDPTQTNVVADSVNDMVAGLEKALGAKLLLSELVTKENEAAKKGGDSLDGLSYAKLREIIRHQKQLILGLQDKLKGSQSSFSKLNDRWMALQSQIKPDLGNKHYDSIADFTQKLEEANKDYNAARRQSESLMRVSSELSATVKRELHVTEDPEPEIEPGSNPSTRVGPDEDTTSRVEIGEEPKKETVTAKSEIAVLKIQLENGQALLDKDEKKIEQLQGLVGEVTNYSQALEKENTELKKTLASEQAHLQRVEQDNNRLTESVTDVDRVITQYKAELHGRDETIRAMKDEVLFLERDLDTFKSHYKNAGINEENMDKKPDTLPMQPSLVALLAEKESKLSERLEELEEKNNEIKDLKRDVGKLMGHMHGVTTLKRQMASRYDRLKIERETMMKSQEALNRKITIMTNLSDKERQTISKLTTLTEELRKDRLEYMNKTFAALRSHKEALGKGMSLTNQVENQQQKNNELIEKNELMKKKQTEALTELSATQRKVKAMEVEMKVLRKQVASAQTMLEGEGAKATEAKIESIRAENKALQTQFVAEQRRADTLAKELKALMYKMKKTA